MPRCALAAAFVFALFCSPLATAAGAAPDSDECEHMLQRLCCGDENLILISGCTPKQKIPLLLGPGDHQVFVDGEQLGEVPDGPQARADRAAQPG
jgi:hypothetical protein